MLIPASSIFGQELGWGVWGQSSHASVHASNLSSKISPGIHLKLGRLWLSLQSHTTVSFLKPKITATPGLKPQPWRRRNHKFSALTIRLVCLLFTISYLYLRSLLVHWVLVPAYMSYPSYLDPFFIFKLSFLSHAHDFCWKFSEVDFILLEFYVSRVNNLVFFSGHWKQRQVVDSINILVKEGALFSKKKMNKEYYELRFFSISNPISSYS